MFIADDRNCSLNEATLANSTACFTFDLDQQLELSQNLLSFTVYQETAQLGQDFKK
jgi:hypothetical protein